MVINLSKIYKTTNGQLLVAIPKRLEKELGLKKGDNWDIVPNRSGGFTGKRKGGGR